MADIFMAGKAEISLFTHPVQRETWFVEILPLDEGTGIQRLFFSGRIHAVIVQPAFPYGDNAGVGGYDFLYAEHVSRCGVLSYMGMDACSAIYIVGADKGISFFIIVRLSTGEDAAYTGRFRMLLIFQKVKAKNERTRQI